jgi:hypothetical protein
MLARSSHQEALKLVIAFMCIMEPEKRAEVMALAERFAEASQIVEGEEAFLHLKQRFGPWDDR